MKEEQPLDEERGSMEKGIKEEENEGERKENKKSGEDNVGKDVVEEQAVDINLVEIRESEKVQSIEEREGRHTPPRTGEPVIWLQIVQLLQKPSS